MKKVWDFVKNIVITVYILMIIFVTICLLSYNDYKVTVFGNTTLVPIIDKDLEPDYSVGDLVIINKNDFSEISLGDTVFFFRTIGGETTINYAAVTGVEPVTEKEVTITVEGGYKFSSSYFIGKSETATVIPLLGRILSILESKWGFLFLGVFPSLIAFLYTIYSIIIEFSGAEDVEEEKTKKKSTKKLNTQKIDKEESKNTKKDETKEEKKSSKKEEIAERPEEKIDDKKVEEKENKKVEEKKEKEESIVQKDTKKDAKKLTDEEKKALIEEKMKTMTKEEKKALLEAKLKSMSPEERKALIEAKKKKIEAEKNNK